MRRFHVHVSVPALEEAIAFYSFLFAAEPVKREANYAKWMLDEPCINFAVSTATKPENVGVDHLGLQVDSRAELESLDDRIRQITAADRQKDVHCCYAVSDKVNLTDPAGISWETFRTTASSPRW